jgi:hypothetical protein
MHSLLGPTLRIGVTSIAIAFAVTGATFAVNWAKW